MVARTTGRPPPPRIDFAAVAASAGDLRTIVANDLGSPDRSGKWRCPFHQERTGSLQVYADHFHCFGCGEHGDALSWVARRQGIGLLEAARMLDPSIPTAGDIGPRGAAGRHPGQSRNHPSPSQTPAPRPGLGPGPPDIWADPEWQSRLSGLVRDAETILWSPAGRPALDWLRRRGLSDQTIRRFRLGFFDVHHWTTSIPHWLDERGQPRHLRVDRGIAIPWLAPGAWYSEDDDEPGEPDGPRWVGMNVRHPAGDVDAPLPESIKKYKAVSGSRRGYLYPLPTIEATQGHLPILLTEGEFDALVGHQEVGHVLHVGTVGSASISARSLPAATRAALARCPWLFLALDVDAAGAGNARKWKEIYPEKSRRVLLPAGKDLNEFILKGGDLAGWLAEIRDRSRASSTGRTDGAAGPDAVTAADRPYPAHRRAAQEAPGAARDGTAVRWPPDGRDRLPGHPGPLLGTVSLADVRRSLAELRHQSRAESSAGPDGHRRETPKTPTVAGLDEKHLLGKLEQEQSQ